MRPNEKAIAQRILDRSLRALAEQATAQAGQSDQLEWIGQIAGRQAPGGFDIRSVGALPDAEAKNYRIHVIPAPPAVASPNGRFEYSVGPDTSVYISGPNEPSPTGAIYSQSVAEARTEALDSRARARAITGVRRENVPGTAINIYGRSTNR